MNGQRWTKEDVDFLRDNYGKLSYPEISKILKRPVESVKTAATRYKITKPRGLSAEQKQIIKDLYPTTPATEIAKIIDCPLHVVYNAAWTLGIRKDPNILLEQNRRLGKSLGDAGRAHQFPKGHVPMNKGLRRPGFSPGRMKETQFKKGGFSPNRREIGEERISDGYIYVKVADGQKNRNWKQKHWVEWERHHGPIAKGTNIIFKDGNRQNCDISNLQAVTDAELMSQNTFHNYPEPIKAQIHLLAGFRRRLNSYAKKQNRGHEKHVVRDDGAANGS